jgi:hypothetical protein
MTRTTPLRRMILHLRQIFFTDANTFISLSEPTVPSRLHGAQSVTPRHLFAVN